tara:strand:- start:81 stop:605 length:525 start_codon:yes stop_codon:yes gene_type:complete
MSESSEAAVTVAMPNLDGAPVEEKSGYLRKLSSKGKWQKRWFETVTSNFVYRKDHEAESILASISVSDISEISLHGEDGSADSTPLCHFTIQIGVRSYEFKATEEAESRAWVELLQARIAAARNLAAGESGGAARAGDRMSSSPSRAAAPTAAGAAGDDSDAVTPKDGCCCIVQ